MNLQLAFRIVNVCAVALTVVSRVLIIVENHQKEKNEEKDVRGKSEPTVTPIRSDSGD